ncbi:MAG: NAD+ synthase [Candidatus Limnocylindrus sp.]
MEKALNGGIPSELSIDVVSVHATLRSFIQDQFKNIGAQNAILGLSGGIDSALVGFLTADAIGSDRLRTYIMPYRTSAPSSREDALAVAKALGCSVEEVPVTAGVDAVEASLPTGVPITPIQRGNIAARMRMITLYHESARHNGIVMGTGNKSEGAIGYTTLHGDAACAINPIGDLYKSQVRALAAHLGVPDAVLTKAPSADLWPGQTDESEGGFDYPTLDRILYRLVDLGASHAEVVADGFDPELVARIQRMIAASQFKREMPPFPKIKR